VVDAGQPALTVFAAAHEYRGCDHQAHVFDVFHRCVSSRPDSQTPNAAVRSADALTLADSLVLEVAIASATFGSCLIAQVRPIEARKLGLASICACTAVLTAAFASAVRPVPASTTSFAFLIEASSAGRRTSRFFS